MFLVALVCLSVCQQDYKKSYERISMKISGSFGGGTRSNLLDFGCNLDQGCLFVCLFICVLAILLENF